MISRTEAEQIARSDAMAHGLGSIVQCVLLPDEITFSAPLLYNINLDNAWVAYIEPIGFFGLSSSTIIVIDRTHGGILYRGSANDEG